ncbi:MAG: glutamate 5-kinase, partial [Planctomycetaceae bacterium]|nr:glutamate 5-kinase [Planctomycetaceae bacterium]
IGERGRSLLAIGITEVQGEFTKGELVSLVDTSGQEIARGLTNYPAHDLQQILGKRTEEISSILGGLPYVEVVHRDNLVLLTNGT